MSGGQGNHGAGARFDLASEEQRRTVRSNGNSFRHMAVSMAIAIAIVIAVWWYGGMVW